jgi:hypothetical protein
MSGLISTLDKGMASYGYIFFRRALDVIWPRRRSTFIAISTGTLGL